MADRVEQRAAELAAVAAKAEAETRSLNEGCIEALTDIGQSFHVALEGHTKYRVLTHLDQDVWCLRNSYFKERFGKIVERQLFNIELDRSELGTNKRRLFRLHLAMDAPIAVSSRSSTAALSGAETILAAVDVAIEMMAASVASGCRLLDPDDALARLRDTRK